MPFAFFKNTTEGWTFGPEPAAEPPIPKQFYFWHSRIEFDKSIPAWNTSAVNQQQSDRNADFALWLKAVKDALAEVGVEMLYNVISGGASWYVLPDTAEVRVGKLESFLSLYAYDSWTPGEVAEQLRSDAKKIL